MEDSSKVAPTARAVTVATKKKMKAIEKTLEGVEGPWKSSLIQQVEAFINEGVKAELTVTAALRATKLSDERREVAENQLDAAQKTKATLEKLIRAVQKENVTCKALLTESSEQNKKLKGSIEEVVNRVEAQEKASKTVLEENGKLSSALEAAMAQQKAQAELSKKESEMHDAQTALSGSKVEMLEVENAALKKLVAAQDDQVSKLASRVEESEKIMKLYTEKLKEIESAGMKAGDMAKSFKTELDLTKQLLASETKGKKDAMEVALALKELQDIDKKRIAQLESLCRTLNDKLKSSKPSPSSDQAAEDVSKKENSENNAPVADSGAVEVKE